MESITDFIGGGFKQMLGKEFRFDTVEQAEEFFMTNLAKDNDSEPARDFWVESIGDDIKEVYEENTITTSKK